MKKLLKLSVGLLFTIFAANAQTGIGTDNPNAKAVLDVAGTGKGIIFPHYATADRATGLTAADIGFTYYDTTLKGYYVWNGTAWSQDPFGAAASITATSSGFSSSLLGYEPVKASQKVTVTTAPGGATVTALGCKVNPANGHVYCAYQLSSGTNFYNTYLLAKQIGGYIVTMTSNAERIWVNTNILANGTGYNLNNNIWIGYNKVSYPGNPVKFLWMTGEEYKIDWSTSPAATPESWFLPSEPSNGGGSGSEGSCHIAGTAASATRGWNDVGGSGTVAYSITIDQVIIEFNEP